MTEYTVAFWAIAAPFLIKITCFILGFFVVRMGYRLLEQGVRGEFRFKGTFAGFRGDLVSASPGLLFLLLGVILIGYAMGIKKGVDVTIPPAIHTQLPSVPLPPLSPPSTKP